MEPRQDIRFCKTSDGVRIATATTGSGPVLVRVGTWCSHLECDLREPESWAAIQEFGCAHTFVRYDPRGCGMSDRRVPQVDFAGLVADLEAVMDLHAPQPTPLYAMSCGAPVAIAYATRHPERVSRIVILNGYGRAYFSSPHTPPQLLEEAGLLIASARQGWGNEKSVFRQVFVSQLLGTKAPGLRGSIDERMRLSMTPQMAEQYLRVNYSMNVKAECALLQCPVLVLHARDDQMVGFEQGRKLAAWIPGARFVPLDSDSHVLPSSEPASRLFFKEANAFLSSDAMQHGSRPRLSRRQTEILTFVAQGMTDKQVARELGLSPRTVEMHVALAMKALDSATRSEAVHKASSEGLLGG
jgi:pimeloyl-ACP methyl ester carboxylesterase/DNA-binding CsgD family transcriptional regulator